MIYLTNIDLNGNQLLNAVIQPLAAAPSSPKLGQIYCDSTSSRIKWYNGTEWKVVGVVVESSSANGSIKVDGVDMTVYTLPVASSIALGGVKVGAGLNIDANGVLKVDVINDLVSTNTDKPLSAAMGKSLKDSIEAINGNIGEMGGGDMMKATYDTNNDGIVDNAARLGGNLPSYYVPAVSGKGLSTEDYTTTEKNKLSGIAAGAEVNVQADWDASSGDAQILNKPTNLSEFTNDENFIDNTVSNLVNYYKKTETYTKSEVNSMISGIATIQVSLVDALPATGSSNIIYLLAREGSSSPDSYDEYLWTGTVFEKIGDTTIDLTNYLTKTGDGSLVTTSFSAAGERSLPATGENISVIIGKIVKYLTDLKEVAFTGSYLDLLSKPSNILHRSSGTISAGQTSVSISCTDIDESYLVSINAYDYITHEPVVVDHIIDTVLDRVTANIATTYPNDIKVYVKWIRQNAY